MKSFVALPLLAATALAAPDSPARVEARASGTSSALPTITVQGNAFFSGSDRFYIRGVDYQPGGSSGASDPLADPSVCMRDIPFFQKLGVNTIRVYTVDNSANHDTCMSALAAAGIYLAVDVNTPNYSLNRAEPGESYNPTYLQSVFATIDAFSGYTNTLLFFSGNEVINDATNTQSAPYVKAVTRDMKQYIGERGLRAIPVGYSAADVSQNQYFMAQYMDCGENATRSDFYSINNYEWCDPSSYQTSGWEALVEQYNNYSLPLFMSEYGCIKGAVTRDFDETKALYQTDMTGRFSGGLVYEYSEEGNGYGLVNISGNTVTPIGSQLSDLEAAFSSTPNPSGNGGFSTTGVVQNCPGQNTNWNTSPFLGSALPAMPSGAVQYLQHGAGAGPGLAGAGSQDAPGGSTATASAGAGAVTATFATGTSAATGSSSSSSSAAAPALVAPFDTRLLGCGAAVLLSTLLGAALL